MSKFSEQQKKITPSLPSGTRDFSPEVVRKRQYIFKTVRDVFELYGFQPIETPAMENLVTLTGKYGEEGDQLIFKVLNNGLNRKSEEDKKKLNAEWDKVLSESYSSSIVTERALRYDLTIPFARYVVMHQNELAFPFRRYQIQPVWRGDKPQKGRYREFWQCDADVIGSTSLINEAELLCIYSSAFEKLGLSTVIKFNSRKILAGLAEVCGEPDRLTDITIALDKLDKVHWPGVVDELASRGLSENAIRKIRELIDSIPTGSHNDFSELKRKMQSSETGMQGIIELEKILEYYRQLKGVIHENTPNSKSEISFSITLARGLSYYTGFIVEVIAKGVEMGSIGGGGRYDDLTGLFGLKEMSGVGISFGIDRTYDVMEKLGKFPKQLNASTKVLIMNLGSIKDNESLLILQKLRAKKINAEIYPDAVKEDKQYKYAMKREIPFILFTEGYTDKFILKNIITKKVFELPMNECIEKIKKYKLS